MKYLKHPQFPLITALAMVLFVACSKDKKLIDDDEDPIAVYDDEKPGELPGFGDADGEPQGVPFVLPAGVELEEPIRGDEDGKDPEDCLYDGPGYNVLVKIKLRRTIPGVNPIRIEFPPGLVIVSTSEGSNQNGLLIEKTILTLPPLQVGGVSRCETTLLLLCTNETKDPSSEYHRYKFGVVTSSKLIKDLIARLQNKKINFSDYTESQNEQRAEAQYAVQQALYAITDGNGLNSYFINELKKIANR